MGSARCQDEVVDPGVVDLGLAFSEEAKLHGDGGVNPEADSAAPIPCFDVEHEWLGSAEFVHDHDAQMREGAVVDLHAACRAV